MSTSENLYEISNDAVAILRKRFLYHTDNNFCAAFLLDQFVAEIASREEYGWFDRAKEPINYHIHASVRYLTAELFGLFAEQDVIDALNLLIDKNLIGNHGKIQGSEQYDFEIYRPRINALSNEYWENIKRRREEEEAKRRVSEVKQQVHPLPPPPPPPQPTPEEVAQQQRERLIARELDRVKSHNKRALNAKLPATLTLEEWLETLEYFEWKCAYCGGSYDLLEHYIPLSHYVGTTRDNCVPACHGCNGVKQAWHPDRIPYTTKRNSLKLQNGIARVREYLEALGKVE